MCLAGNVLSGLVFGCQGNIGTVHEANLELFRAFDHELLNMLRACVKGTLDTSCVPDWTVKRFQDFADTFGGFPCVDKCLKSSYALKSRKARHPCEDVAGIFEWRTVTCGPSPTMLGEWLQTLQDGGFQMVAKEHPLYTFRRERADGQPPPPGNVSS